MDIIKHLFSKFRTEGLSGYKKIPEKDIPIILEQYKLYAELTDRMGERRQTVNSFFLSINSALIAFLSISSILSTSQSSKILNYIIPLAGALLSFTWYMFIKSYRILASSKFQVLLEIEKMLPISPYHTEWEILEKGEKSSNYLQFTLIESIVPWAFFIIYCIIIIIQIPY